MIDSDKIYCEHCIETLARMPDNFIDCVVTSPPYYGLRDYGTDGQIGLEPTPQEYVAKMVEVFREIRRALKADGTVWLNLGDSYSSHKDCKSIGQTLAVGTSRENAHVMSKGLSRVRDSKMLKSQGFKNKEIIGIPWRVAFALQADGWYLRQDIIWSKPNPMPESVTDRCTKAHEYIFLLTKSAKYYYDAGAIAEPAMPDNSIRDRDNTKLNNVPGRSKMCGLKINDYNMRNKRSVWTVTTKPYKESHFATFPEEIPATCIKTTRPDAIIYDPFMGAGTTALVAAKLGRRYIGSELNQDYCKMADDRIRNTMGFLSKVAI
jgi:DNA modification methylase